MIFSCLENRDLFVAIITFKSSVKEIKPLSKEHQFQHHKLTSNLKYAEKIAKIGSKTVEPVLGTCINFLNMKRLNTRGMASANKHVMLSAMVYNLKKLMKFNRPKLKIATQALQKVSLKAGQLCFFIKRLFTNPILQF